jgi:type IV secretory pathway ATPase VirB11/archaellum biosynthesis ATPase
MERPEPTALPEPPASITALVQDGVMDAELAALAWLTIEAGIPVVVAGEPSGARRAVRDALLDLLPFAARTVTLAGEAETFAWMAEAVELGWRHDGPWAPAEGSDRIRAGTSDAPVVLVAELDGDAPGGTWGEHARLLIRALALGYSAAVTARGTRLEDVLGRLAGVPVGAIDDEITRLGVVLILGPDQRGSLRVLAAHYLRPVARDVHGHIQRPPPAVLATWNDTVGEFDHFAWGVVAELGGRTGRRGSELEREQAVRAGRLSVRAGRLATREPAPTPASIPPAPSAG